MFWHAFTEEGLDWTTDSLVLVKDHAKDLRAMGCEQVKVYQLTEAQADAAHEYIRLGRDVAPAVKRAIKEGDAICIGL